jgi:hypothetical protein
MIISYIRIAGNKTNIKVHYLQMCMKEYGCCPKFKRGDNSTYAFTKRGGACTL